MIVPTLPRQAWDDARAWQKKSRIAAQRILSEQPQSRCKSCQDMRQVFLSFLGFGPSEQPSTISKPSTYIEAGERSGWYVIESTAAYECPVCHGAAPAGVHARVKPEVIELAKQVELGLSVSKDGAA